MTIAWFVTTILAVTSLSLSFWIWRDGEPLRQLSRYLAKSQLLPSVLVNMETSETTGGLVALTVSNTGRSPARNVRFSWVLQQSSIISRNVPDDIARVGFRREGLDLLEPGQVIRNLIASETELQWTALIVRTVYEFNQPGVTTERLEDRFMFESDVLSGSPRTAEYYEGVGIECSEQYFSKNWA